MIDVNGVKLAPGKLRSGLKRTSAEDLLPRIGIPHYSFCSNLSFDILHGFGILFYYKW